ncbi:hypothetical protein TNCV_1492151 [Trichonephila clavipes]|nr:hypothetical protein TNCV_1492151 [Trichonephila clavipes]
MPCPTWSRKTSFDSMPSALFRNALRSFLRVVQKAPEFIIVPCSIKSTRKTPRRSQNTVAIFLRSDNVFLALILKEEVVCRHPIDYCFDFGLIRDTYVSSPVTIRLNMYSSFVIATFVA